MNINYPVFVAYSSWSGFANHCILFLFTFYTMCFCLFVCLLQFSSTCLAKDIEKIVIMVYISPMFFVEKQSIEDEMLMLSNPNSRVSFNCYRRWWNTVKMLHYWCPCLPFFKGSYVPFLAGSVSTPVQPPYITEQLVLITKSHGKKWFNLMTVI